MLVQQLDYNGRAYFNLDRDTATLMGIPYDVFLAAYEAENKDVNDIAQAETLAEAQAIVVAQINTWRDGEENRTPDTVTVNDVEWDCDPTARERIVNVLTSDLTVPFWTDANNVDRTDFDLQAIHSAIVYKGFLIHERQRAMKTEVAALTTVEDVQAYVVGWGS